MKLKENFLKTFCLTTLIFGANLAFAGYGEISNEKMNCAIFNKGKLEKKFSCVADGFVGGNSNEGGGFWSFKPIKKHGEISVGMSYNNNHLNYDINDKPAIMQYRNVKDYKVLTAIQAKSFENKRSVGIDLEFAPYTCLYEKGKPQFEFCFDTGFIF